MTALSLFSGCGGDTLGMTNAGFNVVGYSEFNKPAIETHKLNFPDSQLLQDKTPDITKIPDSIFEAYKNKVDLIFAGFNCQGFSNAGKRKIDDPRNQMYLQFVRVVKIVKPKFFIGENVSGLTTLRSGPLDTDPLMIDKIRAAFNDIGYNISYQIVEAVKFGVPQKRKRVILVGWRGTFDPTTFWKSVNDTSKVLVKLRSFVTNSMEGAFEIPKENIPENFAAYALPIAQDAMPSGIVHPFVKLKASKSDSYNEISYKTLLSCVKRISPIHSEIIDLDKPSKTIICSYDHQPRLLVGLRKPDGTCYCRSLLPDELKQIQGFPSSYTIYGNVKDKITQIGNAVPPPIIEAVAAALKKLL